MFTAMFWEKNPAIDPAFDAPCISGLRFETEAEADAYGRTAFGEAFAGVLVIPTTEEAEKPF